MADNTKLSDVVQSFGDFLLKENVCGKAEWEVFLSGMERDKLKESITETEGVREGLASLTHSIQAALDKVPPKEETIVAPEQMQTSQDQVHDTSTSEPTPSKTEFFDKETSHAEGAIERNENKGEEGDLEIGDTRNKTSEELGQNEPHSSENTENVDQKHDSALVQIRASKAEIDRRIGAFIERKRQEVNETNRREFCAVLSLEQVTESCARTDAVFLPRPDSKSHVKVSRVVNKYGPQTRQHLSPTKPHRPSGQPSRPRAGSEPPPLALGSVPEALDERLDSMEKHVSIDCGAQDRKSIYERLKKLEDKILMLESISPEYFNHMPPVKRQRLQDGGGDNNVSAADEAMDLGEINARINTLKKTLGIG